MVLNKILSKQAYVFCQIFKSFQMFYIYIYIIGY